METEELCAVSSAPEERTGSRTACAQSPADVSQAEKGWNQTRIPLGSREGRLIASALISNQRQKTWANRMRLDPPAASPKWPNAAAKPCWKQENLAIRLWIRPHLCWNMRYVSIAPLTLFALKVAALPPLPHPSVVLLLMGSQAQSSHFNLKVQFSIHTIWETLRTL